MFFMMPKYKQTRLLQETFKVNQAEIASRLIQDQANKIKKQEGSEGNENDKELAPVDWINILTKEKGLTSA